MSNLFAGVSTQHLENIARSMRSMFPERELMKAAGPSVLQLHDLKIRTKETGQLIPLRPNPIQVGYLDTILPNWRVDPTGLRGMREIDLKGRQFGLSTLLMGLLFLETIQTPYTNTVIIAHDAPTTEKMFQVVHRMYKHLPEDKKPKTKYESKRELYWPDMDSSFYVGQAGSLNFGAGMTINNVHATEIPRWPNARELMTTILESVPLNGNIFLESTAKGFGDYFQTEWNSAYVNHDSIFTPRFFCWLDFPEYQIDVESYESRGLELPKVAIDFQKDGPTREEIELREVVPITDNQLMWRRWKMQTQRDKFKQEYPLTPEEAFLTTGEPYFDNDYLVKFAKVLTSPEFDPITLPAIPEQFKLLREFRQSLSVWELPRNDRRYIVAADPAEGLTDSGDHDYCSAHVFEASSWNEVAHFHMRLDTHRFGLLLAELGWWYREALVAPERNNHGHAVINAMLHSAYYPLMDASKTSGIYRHEEYDQIKKRKLLANGWPTTVKTKYFALDLLRHAINERQIGIRSRGTVAELLTFVNKDGGKAGAEKGAHDDRVTSLSIIAALLSGHIIHQDGPAIGGMPRGDTGAIATSTLGGAATPAAPRLPKSKQYSPPIR